MLYLLVGSAALDFAVFGDLGLLHLSLKVVGFITMLNENNAIALLDVDETLLIPYQQGDAAYQQYIANGYKLMTMENGDRLWLNMPLLNALKQRGITNIYFFTSMSSSAVKERSELKRELETLGFTVSKVVTEMDFAAAIDPKLVVKLYCDLEAGRRSESASNVSTEQILESGLHQEIANFIVQDPLIRPGLGFDRLLELSNMDGEERLSHLGFDAGSEARNILINNFKAVHQNNEPTISELSDLAMQAYASTLHNLYRIKSRKMALGGHKDLMAISIFESEKNSDSRSRMVYFDDVAAMVEGVKKCADSRDDRPQLDAFQVARKPKPQGTYGQLLDEAGHGYVTIKSGWIVSFLLAIGLNGLARRIALWQTNRQKAKEEGIAPPMFYEVSVNLLSGGVLSPYTVKFEQLESDGITISQFKANLRRSLLIYDNSILVLLDTLEVKEGDETLTAESVLTPPFDKYTITVQIQGQTEAVAQRPVANDSSSTGPVVTVTTAPIPGSQVSTSPTATSSSQTQTTSELESRSPAEDHSADDQP